MSISELRNTLGDYAKDIKINLGNVLTEEGAPELSQTQIHLVALASAYATKNATLIAAMEAEASATLNEVQFLATKSAATIMAMNNVYYRFVHLVGDAEYAKLPANLRMQAMATHGIEKIDFELMSLAVSAINGCGMCMESHTKVLEKHHISKTAIQSSIRIAAVVNATSQALLIG
jgi:alkyl hydroperoxide reductase subunit D